MSSLHGELYRQLLSLFDLDLWFQGYLTIKTLFVINTQYVIRVLNLNTFHHHFKTVIVICKPYDDHTPNMTPYINKCIRSSRYKSYNKF